MTSNKNSDPNKDTSPALNHLIKDLLLFPYKALECGILIHEW